MMHLPSAAPQTNQNSTSLQAQSMMNVGTLPSLSLNGGNTSSAQAASRIDSLANQLHLNQQMQSSIQSIIARNSTSNTNNGNSSSATPNLAALAMNRAATNATSNGLGSVNLSALMNPSALAAANGMSPLAGAAAATAQSQQQVQQQDAMIKAAGLQPADYNFLNQLSSIASNTVNGQQQQNLDQIQIVRKSFKAGEHLSQQDMTKLWNSIDRSSLETAAISMGNNSVSKNSLDQTATTAAITPRSANESPASNLSAPQNSQQQPQRQSQGENGSAGLQPQQLSNIMRINQLHLAQNAHGSALMQPAPAGAQSAPISPRGFGTSMQMSPSLNNMSGAALSLSPHGHANAMSMNSMNGLSGLNLIGMGGFSPLNMSSMSGLGMGMGVMSGLGLTGSGNPVEDAQKTFLEKKKRGYSKQKQMAVFHYTLRHARQYSKVNGMTLEWNFQHLEDKRKIDLKNGIKNPAANISPLLSDDERT